jgi:hypothetical protein
VSYSFFPLNPRIFHLRCWVLIPLLMVGSPAVYSKSNHPLVSSCGDDLFEPNNIRSRARNLSVELKHEREISAKVCQGDQDWYTVWLNRGDLVEFVVTSTIEPPPKVMVYAPRKRKPSGIIRRVSPSVRHLRVYAKTSGRYRLHIKPTREAWSAYTLSVNRPVY